MYGFDIASISRGNWKYIDSTRRDKILKMLFDHPSTRRRRRICSGRTPTSRPSCARLRARQERAKALGAGYEAPSDVGPAALEQDRLRALGYAARIRNEGTRAGRSSRSRRSARGPARRGPEDALRGRHVWSEIRFSAGRPTGRSRPGTGTGREGERGRERRRPPSRQGDGWHEDGTVVLEANYAFGLLDGPWHERWPDGRTGAAIYRKGRLDGPWVSGTATGRSASKAASSTDREGRWVGVARTTGSKRTIEYRGVS